MNEMFRKLAGGIARAMGSPYAFITALGLIIIWAVAGPIFNYSDTWQLAINTSTTIITFLMVFLIQNTQNRDTGAVHLKLDELLRSIKGARNSMIDIENLTDPELDELREHYEKLHIKADKEKSRRTKK